MSVSRRANIFFTVVFIVAVAVAATVFVLARSSVKAVEDYRATTDTFQATMWSLRSDFYNYDDQMNMYVAVLLGGGGKEADLAEATYQQATDARTQMGADLDLAGRLTAA